MENTVVFSTNKDNTKKILESDELAVKVAIQAARYYQDLMEKNYSPEDIGNVADTLKAISKVRY